MRPLLVATLVMWCSAAWADPPALKVTHTEPKVAGDILRVDTQAEGAKSHTWQVWTDIKGTGPTPDQVQTILDNAEAIGLKVKVEDIPTGPTIHHMTFEGGSTIVLPSWAGQDWLIFVSVSSETGEQASEVVHVKIPGGVAPPPPVPPVPPTPPPPPDVDPVVPPGEFAIAQPLYAAAMRVTASDRQKVAQKIVAAAATAAVQNTGQDMINTFEQTMQKSWDSPAQKEPWGDWKSTYIRELERIKPQIGDDVNKWRKVFTEIGVGMVFVR